MRAPGYYWLNVKFTSIWYHLHRLAVEQGRLVHPLFHRFQAA